MQAGVLVTGASGVLGKELLKVLRRENVSYKVAGRSKIEGEDWTLLDLKTGRGVEEAVKGIEIVFHLASSTKGFDRQVDVEGTKKLAEAAKKNGVKHFIFISIVGTDKVDMKYYRIKTETEEVVKQSGLNYSILRATQFHELMDYFFSMVLMLPVGIFSKSLEFQPIETRVVAERLFAISKQAPLNGSINLGGKEVLNTGELIKQWMEAKNSSKWVLGFPNIGGIMKQIANGNLTCNEKADDSITWKQWLKNKYGN